MSLGTMEQRTEGMKRQAQELIDQAYQRGYKAGQELTADRENELIEQGMEHGRNEAWEVAGRLVAMEYWKINDILSDGVLDIKYDEDIFIRLTASEAIEKLKAYDAQKKQEEECIKVGDEVERKKVPGKLIVQSISKIYANCMDCDGGQWTLKFEDIKKTGRHFPQIVEVLKKLKEGE